MEKVGDLEKGYRLEESRGDRVKFSKGEGRICFFDRGRGDIF